MLFRSQITALADGETAPFDVRYQEAYRQAGQVGYRVWQILPGVSILGVRIEDALGALITQMPTRFETADGDVWVMGAVVDVNQSGLADSIEPFLVPAASGAAGS